ncbi:putative quinol monooxygenase [Pseudomonas putida]|uniref:putative quinol monooxygenase n=1 Tax=Pseudomonas putida TaxID=303 RepID=UPI0020C2326B|nr:putative quinol monooxygenase [Pseudomonas putida]UTL79374.1 antibiotic biosynthesis monooxygenase [Pseudomonas putida]
MKFPTLIGACAVACLTAAQALGEDMQTVVRIAQLEIDPAKLQEYEAAVKEEMAESIRLEPGVLAIYSVAEKDQPNRLHFFEIYASDEAYRSHIASAHFQKYAAVTQAMILSKRLIETTPVQLSAQAGK